MTASNNGGGPTSVLPTLRREALTHYKIILREDGENIINDYLCGGYAVDGGGNLHILVNGGIVASVAAGQWLYATRSDFAASRLKD